MRVAARAAVEDIEAPYVGARLVGFVPRARRRITSGVVCHVMSMSGCVREVLSGATRKREPRAVRKAMPGHVRGSVRRSVRGSVCGCSREGARRCCCSVPLQRRTAERPAVGTVIRSRACVLGRSPVTPTSFDMLQRVVSRWRLLPLGALRGLNHLLATGLVAVSSRLCIGARTWVLLQELALARGRQPPGPFPGVAVDLRLDEAGCVFPARLS